MYMENTLHLLRAFLRWSAAQHLETVSQGTQVVDLDFIGISFCLVTLCTKLISDSEAHKPPEVKI